MKKILVLFFTALSFGYGAWQIETVEEPILGFGFDTNPTSIAITRTQAPAIAYVSRPDVETDMSITYAWRLQSIWNKEIILQNYLNSSLADLCLDYADDPYIGIWNMGPYGLVFMRRAGSNWLVDTLVDNSTIEAVAFKLGLPQYPSFAYCRTDSTGNHLYYASWDTSGWLIQPVLLNIGAIKATDLTHYDGKPYVSFIGRYQGITQGLVCANRVTGNWTAETLAMISANAAGRTSILIDRIGSPHIFCYGYLIPANKNGVIHCYDDGSGWQAEVVDTLGSSWWNCPCAACIDQSGRFHLVYTTKHPASRDLSLVYAYHNGTNWLTEKVVSSDTTIASFCGASIAVDSLTIPHLSFRYTDMTNGWSAIQYARRDQPPAVTEKSFPATAKRVILSPGIAKEKISLQLQNISGQVSILLYDQTGRRMSRLYEGEPRNELSFSIEDLTPGVYFLLVESHGQRWIKKLNILK